MSFLYRMIRGAVGKRFVVKHYGGGKVVVTKFPDMSGIVPSGKQRVRRELFREAVVYAKWVVDDEGRKKAFRKTLPWKRRGHVYQAAIRLYMRMQGDQKWLRKQLAAKEVVRSVKDGGMMAGVKAIVSPLSPRPHFGRNHQFIHQFWSLPHFPQMFVFEESEWMVVSDA